jgi:hypothetical protein
MARRNNIKMVLGGNILIEFKGLSVPSNGGLL